MLQAALSPQVCWLVRAAPRARPHDPRAAPPLPPALSFLSFMLPGLDPHGHHAFPPFSNATGPPCAAGRCPGPWDWNLPLDEALSTVVAALAPTALVINSGAWRSSNEWPPALWDGVVAGVKAALAPRGGTMYWKTTTNSAGGRNRTHDEVALKVAAKSGWRVYDAFGATADIMGWRPLPTIDNSHFEAYV